MKSLYETIWYTTVGHTVRHRDNPAPAGPWSDPDLAILALDTWLASEPEASELIAKHRVRVVSYPTQDAAKRANALGHINEGGYERVQGVYGFVRQHKDYDIEPEPTVDNRRTLVGAVLSVVTLVALFGVGLWAWAAPANAAPDNGAAYNLNGADGSHARSTVVVLGPDDIQLGPSIQFHHQPDGSWVSAPVPKQFNCNGQQVSGTRGWTINPEFTVMTAQSTPDCPAVVTITPA